MYQEGLENGLSFKEFSIRSECSELFELTELRKY